MRRRDVITSILSYRWVAVLLGFWAIWTLGMSLRLWHMDEFPIYQNDDGLFHVWAGNSIWDNFAQPASLTIFESGNEHLVWRSQYKNVEPADRFGYRIAEPWFDQPFFSTLLISLPARWFGYTGMVQVPHILVRLPALLAAGASLALVFLLARRLFGTATGFAALITYALWPLAVWSSRQSYMENMMTPFWLLGLLSTWDYVKKPTRWRLLLSIVCAAFMGWSKIIGYAAFGVYGYFLVRHQKMRAGIITFAAGAAALGLYLLYGQIVGGNGFWQTLLNQGGRGTYLSSFFFILTNPDVYGVVKDGWWLLGVLAVARFLTRKQTAHAYIALATMAWFLVVFLTSGVSNTSPWYRYPTYPLLMIAVGEWIVAWWKRGSLTTTIMFLLLGFTGWELAGRDIPGTFLRLAAVGIVGMYGGSQLFANQTVMVWVRRALMLVLLMLMLWGNARAIYDYPSIRCGDKSCIAPTRIEAK